MIYDVICVGGSYAGLSAAMSLGRALRNVLIIDAGEPANRQTPHAHNVITLDGETPAAIAAKARRQVLAYPTVSLVNDRVTEARKTADGFAVSTQTGRTYAARRLLLATGVADQLPAVAGLTDCWGISALHCPYCHGYEVAGQQIGVLANGETAIDMLRLMQQWSKQLTLFTNGPAQFDSAQWAQVGRLNVAVVENELAAVVHESGYVQHLVGATGAVYPLDALFVRPTVAHRNPLAEQLGCTFTPTKLIEASEVGQTSVAGLYAAGDNSTMMRAVSSAMARGAAAGAFLNRELTDEDLLVGNEVG